MGGDAAFSPPRHPPPPQGKQGGDFSRDEQVPRCPSLDSPFSLIWMLWEAVDWGKMFTWDLGMLQVSWAGSGRVEGLGDPLVCSHGCCFPWTTHAPPGHVLPLAHALQGAFLEIDGFIFSRGTAGFSWEGMGSGGWWQHGRPPKCQCWAGGTGGSCPTLWLPHCSGEQGAGAGLGRVSGAGRVNTDNETSATAGESGVSEGWWGQQDPWGQWDAGNSSCQPLLGQPVPFSELERRK